MTYHEGDTIMTAWGYHEVGTVFVPMHADGGTLLRRLMDTIAESVHGPELDLDDADWTMVDLEQPTDEKAHDLGFESLDQWWHDVITGHVLVELSDKFPDGVEIEYTKHGFESKVTGHECTGKNCEYDA